MQDFPSSVFSCIHNEIDDDGRMDGRMNVKIVLRKKVNKRNGSDKFFRP